MWSKENTRPKVEYNVEYLKSDKCGVQQITDKILVFVQEMTGYLCLLVITISVFSLYLQKKLHITQG